MDYRMKREYLKNRHLNDNTEDEKVLVEDCTNNVFHRWNDQLEILTRICDWYCYMFRFYPDGRLVLQMMNANTKDTDSEWRGKDDCGHLEYHSLDDALIDWLDELKKNEGSYKFDEEIEYIENMKNKCDRSDEKEVVLDRVTNKNTSECCDFVICNNCGRLMLVNLGEDTCPECDCKETFSWANDDSKEMSYENAADLLVKMGYILSDTE